MTDAACKLTPLAVVLLGLLRERDMHPYEMVRLIRQRRDDRLVTLTNGTLYHTVGRLQRGGLIDEVGVDRDGNRPERTTYTLTDAGRDASTAWVRRELVRLDRIVEFRVALAEAHDLPRDETIALLRARRDALIAYRAEHRAALEGSRRRGVPFQFLIEFEREDAILTADLDWLDDVLLRLADPRLPWGVDEVPADTMARLTAYRESVTS